MELLTKFARLIGWKTCYWIGYQYPVDGGLFAGDLSMTVRPWVTRENISEIRSEIQSINKTSCVPNITFIQRIGLK